MSAVGSPELSFTSGRWITDGERNGTPSTRCRSGHYRRLETRLQGLKGRKCGLDELGILPGGFLFRKVLPMYEPLEHDNVIITCRVRNLSVLQN
jgi:hypothetical protein